MEDTLLIQKIRNLPPTIQKQVEDYVDFLMERYQVGQPDTDDSPLSAEEIEELQRRYDALKKNPSSGIPYEEVKNRLMKKYGK